MNAREALAELVALKDLKDRFSFDVGAGLTWRNFEAKADYERRQPLAWAAARAVIAEQPAVGGPEPRWSITVERRRSTTE